MNDHLFLCMRFKDEHKQEAIIEATIKLVNEIGFAATSVSKIAKEANVSPATLYIYYKNKEDLLVSTYVTIKRNIGKAILENFDESMPIRDIMKQVWFNIFEYNLKNPQYFHFKEQFANSPYADLINDIDLEKGFEPIFNIIQKGIDQKIIKDVNFDMLVAFMFYPIMTLSNARVCRNITLDNDTIEKAFNLAWDAIKL
jgi:AcrR family transcriptional regulator